MKRSLIFCAIALVAVATNSARADIDVQLNLRYTDPADESAGGTWDLLVESTTADGVAGIVAVIDNVAGAAAAGTTGWDVFETQTVGTAVEIVAGSDLDAPALDVGVAGGTGLVADDLFPSGSPWTHSSLVASGTFGAVRPSFTDIASINATTAGNVIDAGANVSAGTLDRMSVRGDGAATDGLILGDFNRSGDVSLFDDVLLALGNVGVGSTWDEGDIDSSGSISLFDDVLPALGNVGSSTTAPAIAAASVPEPTTIALISLASISLVGFRRR